ncbi:S8 family peptidase [Roseibium aggregatum]|uniref:S8 family peptidase n=1 Tax=Roseibium aggregatum TaxID=187304 RepID=A0A939EHJ4_9HYPH|nr:S8 family peptidase [Roseibium aggregatum]MBN9673083.1 S8 family peptidase [Roseibium aggregatum]
MTDELKRRYSFANSLLFETPGGLRYTQDSPILPNVWLAFAMEPRRQHELILTCAEEGGTGQAAHKIRQMLKNYREKLEKDAAGAGGKAGKGARHPPRVSYIPGQIAVRLYFDEMMRIVLPLTQWWHETYDRLRVLEHTLRDGKNEARVAEWTPFPQPDKTRQREDDLYDALRVLRRKLLVDGKAEDVLNGDRKRLEYVYRIPPDLCWLVRITGLIANCIETDCNLLDDEDELSGPFEKEFNYLQRERANPDLIESSSDLKSRQADANLSLKEAMKARRGVVEAFTRLYGNWAKKDYPTERYIWRVTKNRPVRLAVNKSALTVKADAATRLFDISCGRITWAVVDSGIDPGHGAFRLHSTEHEKEIRKKLELEREAGAEASGDPDREPGELRLEDLTKSRIVKTLDFTRLRELLDYDINAEKSDKKESSKQKIVLQEIARRMEGDDDKAKLRKAAGLLEELKRRIRVGKDINWQDLEDAIVDHNPGVPENDHGTHVAGILGADWIEDLEHERKDSLATRTRKMRGVCPDINLIDVRVFRDDGLTDEFELLAAIQYLRWMNSRAGTMQVHGANLSLSLIHEVRRFACGRTPICDECDEAAAAGMVIVAAAGNRGFEMSEFDEVRASDGYRSVSITDPGNANGVITVGATHRKRPHEYGVSYFSSRGPTGDGRLKPDLVAPGEKIHGPTPYNRAEYKDGTSMAAPHVSGAAAMLMARHTELVAQPEKIKRILCETATDLGRERYFQGHGLVDVLRALQFV